MLSRIEVDPIWSRVVHHFPIHTRNETGVGGTLSLYVAEMTDTKIVFNGDTASGRAQWVPWLRSLALALDEWAWSVFYIPPRHWTNREIGRRFAAPLEPRPKRRHPHGGEIGARRIDPLQLEKDGLCPIGQGGLCGQEGLTTKANGERGRHARLIKRACGWGDAGVHSPQLLPQWSAQRLSGRCVWRWGHLAIHALRRGSAVPGHGCWDDEPLGIHMAGAKSGRTAPGATGEPSR